MTGHELLADSVVLGIVSSIGFALKLWIKPNEMEAKILSRLLLALGMLITGFARRWVSEHREHIDNANFEISTLRNKLRRSKIEPLG